MRLLLTLILGVAAILDSPRVFAWSRGGHETTAVIAYRELSRTHPEVVSQIVELMTQHPASADFASRMKEEKSPSAAHERLFAEMAQWPDEARKGKYKSFHRKTWHTFTIPYLPVQLKSGVVPREGPAENLLWALEENLKILRSSAASQKDRAVALTWVFHLTGDLHQPLHMIALFTDEFPNGDLHGNRFQIRNPSTQKVENLHHFWDGVIIRTLKIAKVREAATKEMQRFSRSDLEELKERPFLGPASLGEWGRKESHLLAISEGYQNGKLKGSPEVSDAPALPQSYVKNAQRVAARRMALAGYRLAEVLNHAFSAAR